MMANINDLRNIASQVRRDILRMTHGAASGHPGGSLGCADLMSALYFSELRHSPLQFSMDGREQDLFFLSNGHISPVWYSVLARSGYFPVKELVTFRKLGTRLQGHPTTAEDLPGVRVASGSLGMGLSVAIGAALAKRLNQDSHLVYVLTGDGELEEGQIWEAALFAAARKLDNLIAIVDWNGQQIDGPVEKVMPLGDLGAKWKAFGWEVLGMDGHDMDDILATLRQAREACFQGHPVMILMKTVMGKGVDFMEGTHHWHGVAPKDDELSRALAQLEETLGDY